MGPVPGIAIARVLALDRGDPSSFMGRVDGREAALNVGDVAARQLDAGKAAHQFLVT